MKQRILCPYCNGEGVITCASCCGCGSVLVAGTEEVGSDSPVGGGSSAEGKSMLVANGGVAAALKPCQCGICEGIGVVACVNCKGEGVSVPVVLQRKQTDMNTDELEMALEEMGVASLAANFANQKARARLSRELAKAAARLEAKENANEDGGGDDDGDEGNGE
eukprot:CAMPEP_0171617622 /NCGR_PEP_ID=MMETSP0990-20121206/14221_1 /TAXON_ID=483369 /ORGANISM="non described non described, Strain CCMP2098" /LENGTH=163 /DNA_ID=CAMNT_0012182191 /DNA_START=238 /DNA_END=729 /DNA_ORIENTATION=-